MRLTAEIRNNIIEAIVGPARKGLDKRHKQEKEALFFPLYCELHSAEHRQIMAKLPKGAFPSAGRSTNWVEVDGQTIGFLPILEEHQELPMFHQVSHQKLRLRSKDSKVAADILDTYRRHDSEEQVFKKRRLEVEAIVKSATTDTALITAWPELEAIVRQYCAEGVGKGTAVAVITEPLNEIFKLPRNKKVDA